MPDEKNNVLADEEEVPSTPLHAYEEGREEDIEGNLEVGEDEGAEGVENTGGSTSGGPGGAAEGEEDPSNI